MPSKDVHNLTSEYFECVTLHGTVDFAEWCCDFSGVHEWAQSNQRGFKLEKLSKLEPKGDLTKI